MSSPSLLKSPFISPSPSFGIYGSGTINPYASYFGHPAQTPQQNQQGQGPTSSTSFSGGGGSPSYSLSSSSNNPFGGGGGGGGSSFFTSPGGGGGFSYSGTGGGGGSQQGFGIGRPSYGGISGGSPSFITPSPAQTQIIGGSGGDRNTSGGTPVPSAPPLSQVEKGGGQWMYGQFHQGFNQGGKEQGSSPLHQSPEPMHYSPISSSGGGSPISPHSYSHPQAVYLPAYFLGLEPPQLMHHQGSSPPPPGGLLGTSPASLGLGGGKGLRPRRTVLFEPKFPEGSEGMDSSTTTVKDKKTGNKKGPPIHGFGAGSVDSLNAKDFLDLIETTNSPQSGLEDQDMAFSPSGGGRLDSFSPSSPTSKSASSDGSSSQSQSSIKCWVTVFGFPQSASSFIVLHFSTLGKIREVKCTPGSNWLHLRFSNPIEARRALSKNGKVLGQSIMVGVIPSDPKVVEVAEKASNSISSAAVNNRDEEDHIGGITLSSKIPNPEPSGSSTKNLDMIKARIRPLAAGPSASSSRSTPAPFAYPSSSSSTTGVISAPAGSVPIIAREPFELERGSDVRPVPKPATGVITKAMEFMFGW